MYSRLLILKRKTDSWLLEEFEKRAAFVKKSCQFPSNHIVDRICVWSFSSVYGVSIKEIIQIGGFNLEGQAKEHWKDNWAMADERCDSILISSRRQLHGYIEFEKCDVRNKKIKEFNFL